MCFARSKAENRHHISGLALLIHAVYSIDIAGYFAVFVTLCRGKMNDRIIPMDTADKHHKPFH